ncbi:hypothetical protein MMC14_010446 [Varicellaria rhodocarpa]|nr:hypothetical protein [Varicellaria rhodocarpa]
MADIFEGQYSDQLWDEFRNDNENYYDIYATSYEAPTLIPSLDYFVSNEMQGTAPQDPLLPQKSEAELVFENPTSTPTQDQQQRPEFQDIDTEGKTSDLEEIKAL